MIIFVSSFLLYLVSILHGAKSAVPPRHIIAHASLFDPKRRDGTVNTNRKRARHAQRPKRRAQIRLPARVRNRMPEPAKHEYPVQRDVRPRAPVAPSQHDAVQRRPRQRQRVRDILQVVVHDALRLDLRRLGLLGCLLGGGLVGVLGRASAGVPLGAAQSDVREDDLREEDDGEDGRGSYCLDAAVVHYFDDDYQGIEMMEAKRQTVPCEWVSYLQVWCVSEK
mmetsp:Transcript_11904/g.17993  ORF Transcript_11904/g.17993 Transcript_11904/m.17993 type:complete len:223 (+) Transcript_11904:688-1356(+)